MQSMQASEPLLRRVRCRREDLFDGHRDFNHIVDKKVIVDRLQSYKQQVIAIKHKVDKHVCVRMCMCVHVRMLAERSLIAFVVQIEMISEHLHNGQEVIGDRLAREAFADSS